MQTPITIKRLTGAIGAELKGVELNHPLDDRTFATIRQAFLDHCVLVFRAQFLDPAAQTAFAHRWGEVLHAPYLKQREMPDHPDVMAQGNIGKGPHNTAEQWHSDLSFMPAPPAHAILSAQVIPETGGDTMFASQYRAYETLSDGEAPPPGPASMAPRSEAGRLVRNRRYGPTAKPSDSTDPPGYRTQRALCEPSLYLLH